MTEKRIARILHIMDIQPTPTLPTPEVGTPTSDVGAVPTPAMPTPSPMMPTPVQPKPKSARWLWTIVLPAIILIAAYFIAAQRTGMWPFVSAELVVTPFPSPSATPDVTANWKTYTNTQYGFEFKYPTNYSPSSTVKTTWAPQIQSEYAKIQVTYNENFNLPDYQTYWQAHPGSKTLTINGLQVIERPVGGTMDGESEYQFDFISKNYSILFLTKSAATQAQLAEFMQILSTFKFMVR